MAWHGSQVSLLDDDWGHVRLCERGLYRLLTSSWTGERGLGGYYRPVTSASLYLNHLVSGRAPGTYHVMNVFLHCACGFLLFRLARVLLPHAPAATAWATLLLFHLLPIHTDTIFWVVGRTDALCALFSLAATLLFLRHLERPSGGALAGVWACCLLASLSKEMALSLPGVLTVVAAQKRRLRTPAALVGVAASCLAIGMCLGLRSTILGGAFTGVPDRNLFLWPRQVLRAAAMVGMTDFRPFGGVLLVLTAVLAACRRQQPGLVRDLAFLVGITLVCLLPALGRIHRWYLYLPSATVSLGVARVWFCTTRQGHVRQRVLATAFALLVAYYGVVLAREARFWREASRLSDGFVQELRPLVDRAPGRVYVLNVPAAYDPPGGLGGKPLFAFGLGVALEMQTPGRKAAGVPVVANHVWVHDTESLRPTVEAAGHDHYRLSVSGGGYFSFHGPGTGSLYSRDGRSVLPGRLETPWGWMQVESKRRLELRIDLSEDDQVLAYDGVSFRPVRSGAAGKKQRTRENRR